MRNNGSWWAGKKIITTRISNHDQGSIPVFWSVCCRLSFGCSENASSGNLDSLVKPESDGTEDQRIQELVTDSVSYVMS